MQCSQLTFRLARLTMLHRINLNGERGLSQIDGNAVSAAVIADLIKSSVATLRKSSASVISNVYELVFEDFDEYLDATAKKCMHVKTVITRDKPYIIDDIYVQTYFKCAEETCDDNALIQHVRDGRRVVVMGFGGIGKTIFAKYLWLSIFREPAGKIPVFYELRRLNALTDVDLETVLRNTVFSAGGREREKIFDFYLQKGNFVFVFDAFDELNEDKRSIVADQILSLSANYPNCSFVVTSRRDYRLEAWEQFYCYTACPFNAKQVKKLVTNVEFDRDVRSKFIKSIVDSNFDSHESFLSTPLLALMMLMTFSQYGELPEKKHIFYRYAFQALYAWHDTYKEGAFKRERVSGLVIDQFEKVFSIFCLLSFAEFDVIFSDDELKKYINKVKGHIDFSLDTEKFIVEADQAVNLIYKEGQFYTFTHRTFQEYFVAFSVVNFFPNKIDRLIERLPLSWSEDALAMMHDINPVIVEENYVLPVFKSFRGELDLLVRETDPLEILRRLDIRFRCGVSVIKFKNAPPSASELHSSAVLAPPSGVMKFADVVSSMFRRNFDRSYGAANYTFSEFLSDKFIALVERVIRSFADYSHEQFFMAYYSIQSETLFVQGSGTKMFHEEKVPLGEIVDDQKALHELSSALKAQIVFARKTSLGVQKQITRKVASIDDLLA